jgi:hypothetical protein
MRAPPIVIVLSVLGGAVCAQTANEAVKGLESCFELARANDAICSNPANSAVERLDCLQKARTAQLECLEHTQSEMPAGSDRQEMPSGGASKDTPTGAVSTEKPAGSGSPKALAKTTDIPSKPPDANWIISETTSPVDYSPLITAVMRVPSIAKDAPNTLAIRCRGLRTELLVRTEGTWRASRANEVQVDYQINDQPLVRLQWAVSVDGKTASYKDDAVDLLRSLPEGGRLKINVLGGPGPGHDATFQLLGFDAVRKKIAAACKWAPVTDKAAAGKR